MAKEADARQAKRQNQADSQHIHAGHKCITADGIVYFCDFIEMGFDDTGLRPSRMKSPNAPKAQGRQRYHDGHRTKNREMLFYFHDQIIAEYHCLE